MTLYVIFFLILSRLGFFVAITSHFLQPGTETSVFGSFILILFRSLYFGDFEIYMVEFSQMFRKIVS